MQFNQHPAIKILVKETLGCTCPDSVFDDIDVEHRSQLADKRINYDRILVGNKLLIYILNAFNISKLPDILPLAVKAGKQERDTMKYNRLRVVLVHGDNGDIEDRAHAIFENIPKKDEKIHLHFISSHEAETLIL